MVEHNHFPNWGRIPKIQPALVKGEKKKKKKKTLPQQLK